jgi:hypothetical protein
MPPLQAVYPAPHYTRFSVTVENSSRIMPCSFPRGFYATVFPAPSAKLSSPRSHRSISQFVCTQQLANRAVHVSGPVQYLGTISFAGGEENKHDHSP